jgi:hypothetical protein
VTPQPRLIVSNPIHAVAYHCMRHILKVRFCRFASNIYLIRSGASASAAFTVARAVASRFRSRLVGGVNIG